MDKIINGVQVLNNDYSYIAAINDGSNSSLDCMGVLASSDVVITSCFQRNSEVTVQIGCVDRSSLNCEIINGTRENFEDFEFIRLDSNSTNTPARFASSSFETNPGDILHVAGYGIRDRSNAGKYYYYRENGEFELNNYYTTNQYSNDELFETTLKFMSNQSCISSVANIAEMFFGDEYEFDPGYFDELANYFMLNQICAAGLDTGVCSLSDAGAPLAYKCDDPNEQDVVIGLSSNFFGCANVGIPQNFFSLLTEEAFQVLNFVTNGKAIFVDERSNFCNGGSPISSVANPTTFPTFSGEWNCSFGTFASNDGCDCNCGSVDPDCDNQLALIKGCPLEEPFCVNGFCSETAVPTNSPTASPTLAPTNSPTLAPVTLEPTDSPVFDLETSEPTQAPVQNDGSDGELSAGALYTLAGACILVGLLAIVVVYLLWQGKKSSQES